MPTPSPIIVASTGATVPMSVNDAITCTSEMPTPRPKSAVRIGSPMATTEPNANNRITTAASRPMRSALPDGGWSA